MPRSRSLVAPLLLAALLVAGCEIEQQPAPGDAVDGHIDTTDLPDISEPEGFAAAYRAAMCALATRCGDRNFYGGGAPCNRASLPGVGEHEPMPDAIVIDPDDAARCLSELDMLDCSHVTLHTVEPLCRRAIVGQVPAGAACTHDLECVGDAWCDGPDGACGCQPRNTPQPTPGLLGDACTSDSMCSTARCVDGACGFRSGEPEAPGEPCGIHWDVEYTDCGPGLYCPSPMDGYCEARTDGHALGESCSQYHTCAPPWACIDGTCAEPRTEGQPCVWHPDCEATSYCLEGTCQPRKPDGEPCDDMELPPVGDDERASFGLDECLSGSCVQGICGQTTFCSPDEVAP